MHRRQVLAWLLAAAVLPVAAQPRRTFSVGLLSQADDARYDASVLQRGFPDAPSGRSLPAAQVALDDSAFPLQAAGLEDARLVAAEAPDAAALPGELDRMLKQGVRHVVLALPAGGVATVAAAARGRDVILFNAAAPEDALRAAQCAANLLHTLPSHAMQMDAIAQLLVARRWTRPLVLVGPASGDALLLAAWQRAARRFGVKPVAQRAFKLSNDPRERDQGNVRLLSAERDYGAVVVLDSEGEFARTVPYQTVLPRPVLGSNGVTAQAWSALWERDGAPQLSRRFLRKAGRPMDSYDWAVWIAVRAAAEAASKLPEATTAQRLRALREGAISVDGYKGQQLSFRAWDGQLRQTLLLSYGSGVADVAPLDGFLHSRSTLDTLGLDAPETGCKAA